MNATLVTTTVSIGGHDYKIRRLSVAKAREILPIVQKLLGGYELDGSEDISPVFLSGLAGALSEAEQTKLVDAFGPATTVDMGDNRELTLKTPAAHDELWAGQLELMIEWLDAAIKFNFAGVIAKTHAVASSVKSKLDAAKAVAESEKSPE